MGLVTHIPPKRVYVPEEDGQWVEIRKLSGSQLNKARRAAATAAIQQAREFGGDLFAVISRADPREIRDVVQQPEHGLDPDTLLHAAVVAWSYADPIDAEHLDALDSETREWLVREIAKFSTRNRTEEETKNS